MVTIKIPDLKIAVGYCSISTIVKIYSLMAGINDICKDGRHGRGYSDRDKEQNMYDKRILSLERPEMSQDDLMI